MHTNVCVCVCVCMCMCVCACVCVCVCVITCLYGWGYLYLCSYSIWVYGCFFLMLSWMFQHDCLDTRCFECLICKCFVFSYLPLFSAIEHVSYGKVLWKYAHYHYYYHSLTSFSTTTPSPVQRCQIAGL